MRIIFENLHENQFLLRSVEAIASGRKPWPAKHQNLLDYYLARKGKLYIYINEKGSWFAGGEYKYLNHEFTRIAECYAICKINMIPWKRVVILKEQDIREDDILISYLYSLGDNTNHGLDKIHCYKILDMNHFYARIPQFRFLPLFDCLISEGDIFSGSKLLNHSAYFREKVFDIVINPYSFRERFVRKIPFSQRKNKAVATGTCEVLHGSRYRDLRRIYHVNCLHPVRMSIHRHKEEWSSHIDSRVSLWPDDELVREDSSKRAEYSGFIQDLKKRCTLRYLGQKKYFSFDMADLYNDYKMAVIGEEIVGSPAVGFVEAMACGCAYVGVGNGMYEQYGMESGVHYIGYDGTSEDMLEKISYYQSHEKELEEIAENGYLFAMKNFNGKTVARNFYQKICGLAQVRLSQEREGRTNKQQEMKRQK